MLSTDPRGLLIPKRRIGSFLIPGIEEYRISLVHHCYFSYYYPVLHNALVLMYFVAILWFPQNSYLRENNSIPSALKSMKHALHFNVSESALLVHICNYFPRYKLVFGKTGLGSHFSIQHPMDPEPLVSFLPHDHSLFWVESFFSLKTIETSPPIVCTHTVCMLMYTIMLQITYPEDPKEIFCSHPNCSCSY